MFDIEDFLMQFLAHQQPQNASNVLGSVNPTHSVSRGFAPPGASQGYQATQLGNQAGLLANPQLFEMLFGGAGVDPSMYQPQVDMEAMQGMFEDVPDMPTVNAWMRAQGPSDAGGANPYSSIVARIVQGDQDPETALNAYRKGLEDIRDSRNRPLGPAEIESRMKQAREIAYKVFEEHNANRSARERNEAISQQFEQMGPPMRESEASQRLRDAGFSTNPATQWSEELIDPSLPLQRQIRNFATRQMLGSLRDKKNPSPDHLSQSNSGENLKRASQQANRNHMQAEREYLMNKNQAHIQARLNRNSGVTPFNDELMRRAMMLQGAGYGS